MGNYVQLFIFAKKLFLTVLQTRNFWLSYGGEQNGKKPFLQWLSQWQETHIEKN